MKHVFSLVLVAFVMLAVSCQSDRAASTKDGSKTELKKKPLGAAQSGSKAAPATGAVNWLKITDLEAKMKEEPRPVLVDLYTSWCGWCKRMDKATFQHKEIAEYLNKNFYSVKFNAESKETVNFNGNSYAHVPGGRRGTNALTHKLILGDKPTGRIGYPTIAFLDKELNRIDAYAGYKDANKFDPVMHYISGEHYKNQTLAEFQSSYKSSIAPSKPAAKRAAPKKNSNTIKLDAKSGQPAKVNIQKKSS